MKLEALLAFLADELSGIRAKAEVSSIARFHRIQASPGYDDAAKHIRSVLGNIGVEHEVQEFVADGVTETFGWIAPPGWRIRSGSLRVLEPMEALLGEYARIPQSILGQSAPGRASGELVHIGKGDTEACFTGQDLKGKFVLSTGRPASMLKFLSETGVAGLIIYPESERAAPSHDLVQYGGLFPEAAQIPWLPMGFSISRRQGERLLAALEKGAVRVEGTVDAAFIDHPMQVLEAAIPGSNAAAQETLLCAHLCHPAQSANDNASGSGLLVEIARVLAKLSKEGRLENTVRMIWVPEFNGAIPWAAANAAKLKRTLVSINLDMVGQSPELIGEPLRVFRIPSTHPVFVNACFEPILETISSHRLTARQGSQRVLHWILDAPSGGSDHLVFQAPPVDVPSVMFGHDDPYWHTDLDTLEKVDPTRLMHVGILSALIALLPSWGNEEPELLSEWLARYSLRVLVEASALARSAHDGGGRLLLDEALAMETERAQSLAAFSDGAWQPDAHLRVLVALHAALVDEARDGSPRPGADGGRFVRAMKGPVRYAALQDLSKEDQDFLEAKLFSHHGAPPQVLANLANGSRTLEEMVARLTLDFGRNFARNDIERALDLLQQIGYVKRSP